MEYDVDAFEIVKEDIDKEPGKRLTEFNCSVCKLPLTEAELSAIRNAHAPCMHYDCFCKLPPPK